MTALQKIAQKGGAFRLTLVGPKSEADPLVPTDGDERYVLVMNRRAAPSLVPGCQWMSPSEFFSAAATSDAA